MNNPNTVEELIRTLSELGEDEDITPEDMVKIAELAESTITISEEDDSTEDDASEEK